MLHKRKVRGLLGMRRNGEMHQTRHLETHPRQGKQKQPQNHPQQRQSRILERAPRMVVTNFQRWRLEFRKQLLRLTINSSFGQLQHISTSTKNPFSHSHRKAFSEKQTSTCQRYSPEIYLHISNHYPNKTPNRTSAQRGKTSVKHPTQGWQSWGREAAKLHSCLQTND